MATGDDATLKGPGAKIAARRDGLGKTQEQMANDAGMSQAYYSKIERGGQSLKNLTQGRLEALAKALQWSLVELQEAVGVDLGLVAQPNQPSDQQAVAVRPIALGDRPLPSGAAFVTLRLNPDEQRPGLLLLRLQDPEMQGQRLFAGATLFVDCDDTVLQNKHCYLIEIKNDFKVRRVYHIADIWVFQADQPARGLQKPILSTEVRIVGRVYRQKIDQEFHDN
jgi:transcriptional regulator with XRE-family HTH domain